MEGSTFCYKHLPVTFENEVIRSSRLTVEYEELESCLRKLAQVTESMRDHERNRAFAAFTQMMRRAEDQPNLTFEIEHAPGDDYPEVRIVSSNSNNALSTTSCCLPPKNCVTPTTSSCACPLMNNGPPLLETYISLHSEAAGSERPCRQLAPCWPGCDHAPATCR